MSEVCMIIEIFISDQLQGDSNSALKLEKNT